jgi:hypothetical protein
MQQVKQIIPAIETSYNGYKFRSRLEARWARFFDVLGVKYEYEPEGFDLSKIPHIGEYLDPSDTWYLPDFWLPRQGCYMEIKPLLTPVDSTAITKCYLLNSSKPVLITFGSPGLNSYRIVSCTTGKELPDFWKRENVNVAYAAARSARF